jgi:ketosteroid isomerase-like protein
MHKIPILFFVAIVCCGLLSCNTDGTEKTSAPLPDSLDFDKAWAKSFIDSINLRFSREIAAGDSVALASHYWQDAQMLLDNSEPVNGDKIVNAWGAAIRAGMNSMTFTTTDLKGGPNFLIETGSYEMKLGKNPVIDRGKYIVVWEKRNGEWKLYRDIGSTSMPAEKP